MQVEKGDGAVRITLIGLGVNLALVGLKFAVGLLTGSMALVADGVHSLSDLATDLVVLAGLRLARRPADASHSFGHGKFETLATAVVGVVLLLAGVWIAVEAVGALREGRAEVPGPIVAGVAAASVVAKEWLFRATRKVARRLRSSSLEANAWHHRSDALSSLAVLVGGVLTAVGWSPGDPAAAVAVAALIAWAAGRILYQTLHELTEGSLSPAERDRVARAIGAVEGVQGWHKLRTRSSGSGALVDVHIQVDPALSVAASHAIATRVEEAVRGVLGEGASVVVHVEPSSPPDAG
ncbi:MAG: cation diffusion facilitator family transporter [Candidatus Bipolaricaulota bacterium]|nr:cation diffusion facilitator family transporter [Candidatus Bipolaricaulota bacterium]